jgi:hypothetical protein
MPGEIVINKTAFLCHINRKISRCINLPEAKVYISSRVLKHLYDKRPAQEYDCLLENIFGITRYPDLLYINKRDKSGDYIFVKAIQGYSYMCSAKFIRINDCSKLNIITAFSVKPEYMKDFKLIWSWK